MKNIIKVKGKMIGHGQPTFIVAEIGINHNGDTELAKEMIVAAAEAGVDAVKFQAFRAESLTSKTTKKAEHQKRALGLDESPYEMWKRLEFSIEDFHQLKIQSEKCGLIFFSSIFDEDSLEMMSGIDTPLFKIASGDLTYLPFIRKVATKQKPIILSVGMGTLQEIADAIEEIHSVGNKEVILLQCTAQYPANISEINLLKMGKLQEVFDVPVGLSDHSTSLIVPALAAGFGASVIERHFTIDKNLSGSDQKMSTDPAEMKAIVEGVREAEKSLGSSYIGPTDSEQEGRKLFRRSLIAETDIPEGTVLTRKMISIKRPATGIDPKFLEEIIGRKTRRALSVDEPITWDVV